MTSSGLKCFLVGRGGRAQGHRGGGEGKVGWDGGGGGGATGCQGGPLGHEIKKRMQRDTRKINSEDGLPGLV